MEATLSETARPDESRIIPSKGKAPPAKSQKSSTTPPRIRWITSLHGVPKQFPTPF